MKRLYIIRHAKSSWKDPGLTDFDRPLNKRGKKDAPRMGKYLKKNKHIPDLIVSSPAKRAHHTAESIAETIGYPSGKIHKDERIYESDSSTLFEIIKGIKDSHKKVFLVGHNPSLTYLALNLSDQNIDNIPTCGVFCLDFKVKSWKDIKPDVAKFVFFDYPKNIPGKA